VPGVVAAASARQREVIGEALRLALDGDGQRRIARKLQRPPGDRPRVAASGAPAR
jgi:hypothetical protein